MVGGSGIRIMVMSGHHITHGAGLHTTMADGIMTTVWAGTGCRATDGLPPGYHGTIMTITTGGVHSVYITGLLLLLIIDGEGDIDTGMESLCIQHRQFLLRRKTSWLLILTKFWLRQKVI